MRYVPWMGATLLLLGTMASPADEPKLPDPPKGFSWKKVTEINATFLLPAGWHYHHEKKGQTFAAFLTKEKIDKGKPFQTGLSVNVIRGRKNFDAEQFAQTFIAALAEKGKVVKQWKMTQGKLRGYGCRVLAAAKAGGPKAMMHVLALANTTTQTLYLIQFESPEANWNEARQTGETIMDRLLIDDEI